MEGRNRCCFCSSAHPPVAYIANNSRTQRPSVPKFGRKVPHLWCNSHTSFKVRRWKDEVTRPINADTHRVPYFPNGKAYEHQTWYTDGGRRPTLARGTMTSKVKGQGRKVTWTVWAVLAQCCSCVIRSGLGHTVSAEPHFLLYFCTSGMNIDPAWPKIYRPYQQYYSQSILRLSLQQL